MRVGKKAKTPVKNKSHAAAPAAHKPAKAAKKAPLNRVLHKVFSGRRNPLVAVIVVVAVVGLGYWAISSFADVSPSITLTSAQGDSWHCGYVLGRVWDANATVKCTHTCQHAGTEVQTNTGTAAKPHMVTWYCTSNVNQSLTDPNHCGSLNRKILTASEVGLPGGCLKDPAGTDTSSPQCIDADPYYVVNSSDPSGKSGDDMCHPTGWTPPAPVSSGGGGSTSGSGSTSSPAPAATPNTATSINLTTAQADSWHCGYVLGRKWDDSASIKCQHQCITGNAVQTNTGTAASPKMVTWYCTSNVNQAITSAAHCTDQLHRKMLTATEVGLPGGCLVDPNSNDTSSPQCVDGYPHYKANSSNPGGSPNEDMCHDALWGTATSGGSGGTSGGTTSGSTSGTKSTTASGSTAGGGAVSGSGSSGSTSGVRGGATDLPNIPKSIQQQHLAQAHTVVAVKAKDGKVEHKAAAGQNPHKDTTPTKPACKDATTGKVVARNADGSCPESSTPACQKGSNTSLNRAGTACKPTVVTETHAVAVAPFSQLSSSDCQLLGRESITKGNNGDHGCSLQTCAVATDSYIVPAGRVNGGLGYYCQSSKTGVQYAEVMDSTCSSDLHRKWVAGYECVQSTKSHAKNKDGDTILNSPLCVGKYSTYVIHSDAYDECVKPSTAQQAAGAAQKPGKAVSATVTYSQEALCNKMSAMTGDHWNGKACVPVRSTKCTAHDNSGKDDTCPRAVGSGEFANLFDSGSVKYRKAVDSTTCSNDQGATTISGKTFIIAAGNCKIKAGSLIKAKGSTYYDSNNDLTEYTLLLGGGSSSSAKPSTTNSSPSASSTAGTCKVSGKTYTRGSSTHCPLPIDPATFGARFSTATTWYGAVPKGCQASQYVSAFGGYSEGTTVGRNFQVTNCSVASGSKHFQWVSGNGHDNQWYENQGTLAQGGPKPAQVACTTTFSPANPVAGQKATVTTTLTNSGGSAASNVGMTVYIAAKGASMSAADPNTMELGQTLAKPLPLQPGKKAIATNSGTIPIRVPSGKAMKGGHIFTVATGFETGNDGICGSATVN